MYSGKIVAANRYRLPRIYICTIYSQIILFNTVLNV